MDGTLLTAFRTAAGSGLATQILSSEESKTLVVFGAGAQARQHVDAVLAVRPGIEEVVVANRSAPRAVALAEDVAALHTGVSARTVLFSDAVGLETAVRAADVWVSVVWCRGGVGRGEGVGWGGDQGAQAHPTITITPASASARWPTTRSLMGGGSGQGAT